MSSEEYRDQVQKRWQETMALLGFDDAGPAPEPEKPKAKTPPPMPPATEPEPAHSKFPPTAAAEAPPPQTAAPTPDYDEWYGRQESETAPVKTTRQELENQA